MVMEHFDPEEALALIERYRVTHSQWVPTMFSQLLKLPDDVRRRYDVSSQRVVAHAAAPCPRAVKEAMFDWWGPIWFEQERAQFEYHDTPETTKASRHPVHDN